MEEQRGDMPGRRDEDRWVKWDKRLRDVALFIFGAIGFFYEMTQRAEPELIMIVASGALMGVPLLMSASEKHYDKNGKGDNHVSQ